MKYELDKNKIKKVSSSIEDIQPEKKEPKADILKVADAFEKGVEDSIKKANKEKEEVKEEKDLSKLPEPDDSYYYDSVGTKRPNIYSNKRRKEIEKRLKPISVEDIILRRRVSQLIPIIPGKFEIVLRDTTGKEDKFIKDLIAKFSMEKEQETTTASVHARMALYYITFALQEINGTPLTNVSIKKDPPSEDEIKEFNTKLDFISDYPDDFIEEINAQMIWFRDRVKRTITTEDITNF